MPSLEVREMHLSETQLVIDYFHGATAEFLDLLGVDPTRLPPRAQMESVFAQELSKPINKRQAYFLIWRVDAEAIGFSSCNKIVFGEEAYMHLHVVKPDQRRTGFGAECVRKGVALYFDALQLKRLYREPNAFNVAPNRTLQKAGFSYVKTHMTVPGAINYRQAVTRWILERPQ